MFLDPFIRSLVIALCAALPAAAVAVPVSFWLTRTGSRMRPLVSVVSYLPLVLPPVVTGYVLLWAFGAGGPLNAVSELLPFDIVLGPAGAVLAAAITAFPVIIWSCGAAFADVDPQLERAAATLGAGPLRRFFTVSLPLARRGVAAGLLLGYARALGEFGATIIVAGNIPGHTRTIPLAVYSAIMAADTDLAFKFVGLAVLPAAVIAAGAVLLLERKPAR